MVIATRDDAALIERRVNNLFETEYPSSLLNVIIALDANGASATPESLSHLDKRAVVIVGDTPGGKACTLNTGVRCATGDIIVFADTSQNFDARTIPELVSCLDDDQVGAVSGALTLGGDSRTISPLHAYWRMEKWLRYNESKLHSTIGVTGAVYAVRRALWREIPVGTLLDDVYVPMSIVLAGHRVAFTYAARAVDVRSFDVDAESTRKTRTLTGVMQLLHLLPTLLTSANPVRLQFIMHKLARLATPFLLGIFAASGVILLVLSAFHYPAATLWPMAAVAAVVATVPALRRIVVHSMRWVIALQIATLRAVDNGLRARWGVWQKPK